MEPWDEKGYIFPGGLPYTPKGAMIWAASSSTLRKMSYNNYPAQSAILSALYEGVQVPIDAEDATSVGNEFSLAIRRLSP